MYEVKFVLQKPTMRTKRRLLEVKFYMVYKTLLGIGDIFKLTAFLEALAIFYEVDKTKLTITANMLRKMGAKPTKFETVIACRLLGMSYVNIKKAVGVDMRTITTYIKRYIEEDEPELRPVLQPVLHEFITGFFVALEKGFLEPFRKAELFNDLKIDLEEDEE
jgi:hypothetical protein